MADRLPIVLDIVGRLRSHTIHPSQLPVPVEGLSHQPLLIPHGNSGDVRRVSKHTIRDVDLVVVIETHPAEAALRKLHTLFETLAAEHRAHEAGLRLLSPSASQRRSLGRAAGYASAMTNAAERVQECLEALRGA